MAKTFYTSGTGSQQTLTGSQDEKVAVYQTVADVEADLANLGAGQIVATPDTGDENAQPVDEVTDGDMHAVTSNAVAGAIGALDATSVGGTGKYISAISETDGVISATEKEISTTPTSGLLRPITSDAVYRALLNVPALRIRDTRDDNFSPSYYLTNYQSYITAELKFQEVVDNPFSTRQGFCILITIVPWGDLSGGFPTQIAIDTHYGYGIKRRMANANYEWGSWVSL